jgi:hypothetical protein
MTLTWHLTQERTENIVNAINSRTLSKARRASYRECMFELIALSYHANMTLDTRTSRRQAMRIWKNEFWEIVFELIATSYHANVTFWLSDERLIQDWTDRKHRERYQQKNILENTTSIVSRHIANIMFWRTSNRSTSRTFNHRRTYIFNINHEEIFRHEEISRHEEIFRHE